jgi:hypothetical protein
VNVETVPFKHVVLVDFWADDLLEDVVAEFPDAIDDRWSLFANEQEFKLGGTDEMWGVHTWELFEDEINEPALLAELATAFGIGAPLEMDAAYGGGYHLIPPGGYLHSHVDFSRHPDTDLWRRLNLIIFLNKDWDPADGGQLLLGAAGEVVVEPRWNTTVIFETNDRSWHGHPTPTGKDFWRRSVAAYFYSTERSPETVDEHDTVFLGEDAS